MNKESTYNEYKTLNENIHLKDKIQKNFDSVNKSPSLNLQEDEIFDDSIIFEVEEDSINQNSSSIEISK